MRTKLLLFLPVLALLILAVGAAQGSEYVMPRSFVVGPGEHILKYNGSAYVLKTDIPLEILFNYLGNDDYRVIFKNRHPEAGGEGDKEIFLSIRANNQIVYMGPAPEFEEEVYYTNETGYTEP